MEVVKSNFFTKSNHTIHSAVRNSSCSRGWLRLTVQSIFGLVTVASFVLIVIMAITRTSGFRPAKEGTCAATNCRVTCGDGHYDNDYEQNILSVVLESGLNCEKIILTLRDVQFANETMPLNWLSRMAPNIEKLFIIGGNLHHIPPTAFLAQFAGSLQELVFEKISISSWTSDTFVGLSNLKALVIKDSVLHNIERNALRAIDETIETVSVTSCGKWDPAFVTGTSSLERVKNVFLSQNEFGSTLQAKSFTGLSLCKVLFLNTCKITSIGAGAFDFLENIVMLFLNDNYLIHIPPGLFTTVLTIEHPRPRIHLQDNPWKCDCSQTDLMLLSKKDLLLVDPICHRPEHMYGKPFSKLDEYCKEEEDDVEVIIITKDKPNSEPPSDIFKGPCFHGNKLLPNTSLHVISPAAQFRCQFREVYHFDRIPRNWSEHSDIVEITSNNWLKPNFIMQNEAHSTIQVGSSAKDGYGLVWHQSSCPNEAYCVNVMPNFLRVYNILLYTIYTFCPINLRTAEIEIDNCVRYDTSFFNNERAGDTTLQESPVLFAVTALICICLGALFVYGLIRKNPSLLKGSKRLLFVKHRGVDALVLPPKIPLRNSLSGEENMAFNGDKIFTVYDEQKHENHFQRSRSVRSDKSTTPTYVSAMQPTEAQLAEWRIRNHFDKNDSIISITSDASKYSWLCESCSGNSSNVVYESLK